MTPEEYAAAVESVKREFGEETLRLEARAEQARLTLERCEKKLVGIRQEFSDRLAKLAAVYVGILDSDGELNSREPHGKPISRNDESRNGIRKQRVSPGALDTRVLEVARLLLDCEYTIADVEEIWKVSYPNEPISRSTIRSVLERHIGTEVEVTHEGGAGRSNPRRYRSIAQPAISADLRAL